MFYCINMKRTFLLRFVNFLTIRWLFRDKRRWKRRQHGIDVLNVVRNWWTSISGTTKRAYTLTTTVFLKLPRPTNPQPHSGLSGQESQLPYKPPKWSNEHSRNSLLSVVLSPEQKHQRETSLSMPPIVNGIILLAGLHIKCSHGTVSVATVTKKKLKTSRTAGFTRSSNPLSILTASSSKSTTSRTIIQHTKWTPSTGTRGVILRVLQGKDLVG